MIIAIKAFVYDLDDTENLNKFFNLIQQFNKGKPINPELRTKIEKHFSFKWNNDRNVSVSDAEALVWMSQIPDSTKQDIYQNFLFKNFIKQYQHFFILFRKDSPFKC